MFPFKSATSLKHLRWEGPGIQVPLQALENSKQLTSLDLNITDASGTNSISLWPSLTELRSLTLLNYSPPIGAYIAHAFTVFTKYASSNSPNALIALSVVLSFHFRDYVSGQFYSTIVKALEKLEAFRL